MGFVYKLVEINGRPVAKKAKDKASIGGRKFVYRILQDGNIVDEVFTTSRENYPTAEQGQTVVGGIQTFNIMGEQRPTLDEVKRFAHDARGMLPLGERKVWNGDFGPYITSHPDKE